MLALSVVLLGSVCQSIVYHVAISRTEI